MVPLLHLVATPSSSGQAYSLIDYTVELFVIEVLLSQPVPENKSGYDALRMRPTRIIHGSLLFNIYTYYLPVTVGRIFAYAYNLAILHYARNWQA